MVLHQNVLSTLNIFFKHLHKLTSFQATLVGGVTGQAIPLTLFGAAMFLAGLSTIFLPETLHRQLPDSIEDAVNMRKK